MVSLTVFQDIEDPTVANAVDRKDGVPPHKLGTTENGDIKAERDKLQVPIAHDFTFTVQVLHVYAYPIRGAFAVYLCIQAQGRMG